MLARSDASSGRSCQTRVRLAGEMRSGSAKMMSSATAAAPARPGDQRAAPGGRAATAIGRALAGSLRRCRRCGPAGRRDRRAALPLIAVEDEVPQLDRSIGTLLPRPARQARRSSSSARESGRRPAFHRPRGECESSGQVWRAAGKASSGDRRRSGPAGRGWLRWRVHVKRVAHANPRSRPVAAAQGGREITPWHCRRAELVGRRRRRRRACRRRQRRRCGRGHRALPPESSSPG